jgi:hypothetical protein
MTCPVCGYHEPKNGKPRSIDQLRRYHSLIRAAYEHLPESFDQQFSSLTEFRKWCEMKVGWREIGAKIELRRISKEQAMMLAEVAIRGTGSFAWPVIHGDTLVIFRPKSVAFTAMPHLEFTALSNAIDDLIREIIGVEPEQLLKERERAVA